MSFVFGEPKFCNDLQMTKHLHLKSLFAFRANSSLDELCDFFPDLLNADREIRVLPSSSTSLESAKILLSEQLANQHLPVAMLVSCEIPATLKRAMIHQQTADKLQNAIGMVMAKKKHFKGQASANSLLSKHLNRLNQLSSQYKKCPECHSKVNVKNLDTPFCTACNSFGVFFSIAELNRYHHLADAWHASQVRSNTYMRQYSSEVLAGKFIDPSHTSFWVVGFHSNGDGGHDD